MQRINSRNGPVAIGGLGGSGTRVAARMLREGGLYIGDALNEADDNLWFTLLFRRPEKIRNPDDKRLTPLLELFAARMDGRHRWSLREQRQLWSCALEFIRYNYVPSQRAGFPLRTLRSFFKRSRKSNAGWGWKEPNAHIFLPLLMEHFENLRYVHVLRHPLDAAFGGNQRQLINWGFLFGIHDAGPQAMLRFHQAANRRAIALGERMGERFMLIRYEELCAAPDVWSKRLLDFAGLDASEHAVSRVQRIADPERATPRYTPLADTHLVSFANRIAVEFGYPAIQPADR
jgi:hypothetical protein